MFDAFLLLTPVLMLAVVALLGFVGCRSGFDDLQPPAGFVATARCGWVQLNWDPVVKSPNYDLVRIAGGYEHLIYHGPDTSFNDTWILDGANWSPPSYKIRSIFSPGYLSDYSTPITPVGMPRALVTIPGTALNFRTNYAGYIGMAIQTSKLLTVCGIGRYAAPGDGTNPNAAITTHVLRIIDPVRQTIVGEAALSTVPGSNSTFDPNDHFVYARFPTPIELMADSVNPQGTFYIVSQETDTSGNPIPEPWCDGDTPVTSTADAVVIGSVAGDLGGWVIQKTGGYSFGPVNILYNVSPIIF